jgi:hypothetical protein
MCRYLQLSLILYAAFNNEDYSQKAANVLRKSRLKLPQFRTYVEVTFKEPKSELK